jgi:hypothetical protein
VNQPLLFRREDAIRSSIGGLQHASELDLLDTKQSMPISSSRRQSSSARLASSSLMKSLYRFRVVKLGERIQAHRMEPYSATRGEASVSRSRYLCFGGRAEALIEPQLPTCRWVTAGRR